MTKLKMTTIALGLTTVMVLALTAASAGPGPRGPGYGGPDGMGMLHGLMRLDLTEEQRDAIRAVFDTFQPRVEAARTTLHDLRTELHRTLRDSGYDVAIVTPIAESIGTATTRMTLIHAEMRAEILALLTPEQIEQLDELVEDRLDQRPRRRR